MEFLSNVMSRIDLQKLGFPNFENVIAVERTIYDDRDEIYSIFYDGDTIQYDVLIPHDQNLPVQTEKIKLSDDEYEDIIASIIKDCFEQE